MGSWDGRNSGHRPDLECDREADRRRASPSDSSGRVRGGAPPSLGGDGGWPPFSLSGDGAVLSHRSATALFGAWGSGAGEIQVTVPRKLRSQPPIRRHFSALPADECEIVDGIPDHRRPAPSSTSPEKRARRRASRPRELEYLGIYGKVSLPTLLARHPKHPGVQAVGSP